MNLRRTAACCVVALSATLLTLIGSSSALAAPVDDDAVTPCPAVEVISVRGSGADRLDPASIPYAQAQDIRKSSKQNVRVVDLRYPALPYNPSTYPGSVSAGVDNLRGRLDKVSSNCPGITFALVGYSQGAQVVGNVLSGQSVPGGAKIKAVVLFGDPKFNNKAGYDFGSYTENNGRFNGVFGPRPLGSFGPFGDRARSYCRANDEVCQAGSSGDGHFRYGENQANATAFVLNKIGG